MNALESAREEINRIDAEMAALFEARMKAVAGVAAYKKENGLPIRDPAREEALIARCRGRIADPAVEAQYVPFLRSVIDVSCAYQDSLIQGRKVAFSGVEGAYAHIAARKLFPEARFQGYTSFEQAYQAVESGACDCAVLPLENSYAGEVGTVMDLLFTGSLYINQLLDLPVRHGLLGLPGAELGNIRAVYSHGQALHQCEGYLAGRGWETVECANPALAAQRVLSLGDPTVAAIASEEAAELYGLQLLEGGINDATNNTTRFAVLSRSQNRPARAGLRDNAGFILLFTVQNKAGALAQTLNIIGAHGYNMKNLRSRPMKDLQWNYYFYIEAEGNIVGENGDMLLRELGALCARLKLVGIY
ncbi:MAG: chorismate mutase [Clostridia bacterium]|nr:chorismate mutase [Clostridia bacterium]